MFRGLKRRCAGVSVALTSAIFLAPAWGSDDVGKTLTSQVTPVAGDDVLMLGWDNERVTNFSVSASLEPTMRISEAAPPAAPLPSAFWSTVGTLGGLAAIWGVRRLMRKPI